MGAKTVMKSRMNTDPVLGVSSSNRVLNAAVAAGVAGLAVGAFVLSFESLRDLAVACGFQSVTAFLLPVIVDGFIVVATGAAFAMKGRGAGVTWYPWAALVVFSAISVVGNGLHAANPATRLLVPVPVAAVVSAVPSVALLVASHLLVLMVASPGRRARRPHRTQAAAEPVARELAAPVQPEPARQAPGSAVTSGAPVAERPSAAAVGPGAGVEDAWRTRVLSGEDVSAAQVAEALGVSERTARRRISGWRADGEASRPVLHRVPEVA